MTEHLAQKLWGTTERLELAVFLPTPDTPDAPLCLSQSVGLAPMAVHDAPDLKIGARFNEPDLDNSLAEWEIAHIESYAGGEDAVYAAVHVCHCTRVTVEPEAETLGEKSAPRALAAGRGGV